MRKNMSKEVNQGNRIVFDMVKGEKQSGRNIKANNFFTILSIAKELQQQQISVLGNIPKSRKESPKEFSTTKGKV